MALYRLLEEERLRRLRQRLGMPEPAEQNPFAQYLARPQAAREPIAPGKVQPAENLGPDAMARARREIEARYPQPTAGGFSAVGMGEGLRALLGLAGKGLEATNKVLSPVAEPLWRASGYGDAEIEALKESGQILDPLFFALPPGLKMLGGLEAAAAGVKAGQVARAIPSVAKSYVQAAARGPAAQAVVPVGKARTLARLGEEHLGKLRTVGKSADELANEIDETNAMLEAVRTPGKPVPKFGTAERSEYDAARMRASEEGRAPLSKKQLESDLRERLAILNEELDAVLAKAPPEQAIGGVQAGMGIGEKPAQGGLFENLRGEAQRVELASPENLAAQQARRQAIAAGQAELPVGAEAAPKAVIRHKQNYGSGRSVFFVEYEYQGERLITGTVVRGNEKSLGWYFGKGPEGLKEANRIALLPDKAFSEAENLAQYSWAKTRKALVPPAPSVAPAPTTVPPSGTRGRATKAVAPKAAAAPEEGIGTEGLPRNPDGTVTLYHGTTPSGAEAILRTKTLIGKEDAVFFTTDKAAARDFGSEVLEIRVDPRKLQLDDEFPSGRQDFRIPARLGKTGTAPLSNPVPFISAVRIKAPVAPKAAKAAGVTEPVITSTPMQPKSIVLRQEPEPLNPSGVKWVAYEADGTRLFIAEETAKAAETRVRATGIPIKDIRVEAPTTPSAAVVPPSAARPVGPSAVKPSAAAPSASGAALPSGRVPGGPRAQPLPPRQPPPPIQPLAPSAGALPSGRRPGGPQNVRPAAPVDNYQRVVEALTPERDPLIKRVWNSLPRLWYDRNYPFKAISDQTGVPVRQIAQAVPGSGAAAENIVRKFYAPIRTAVGADEKRLLEYLVLRRNDDILARNPSALLPGGVTGSAGNIQALRTLARKLGPERFAKLETAAKEVWRLNDEMVLQPMVAWEKGDRELARLLDMGIRPEPIISKELYRQLRTSHPHYVSFKRADFTDFLDEIETSFGRPEVNIASTGLKRMDLAGSERRLSLTFETLLSDVYRTQALLARNRAAKSLGDALIEAQRLTGDEVIRFIEPSGTLATARRVTAAPPLPMGRAGVPPAKLDGRLSFYHNGEKYVAEVSREMEAAAKGLYAEPDNLILSVLRALAQPLRRGATEFDPFFLPMNVIRDSMSALFREKMIPFGPDHLAGLWGAIRKNALFERAANDGALISGFVETGRGMGMRTRSATGALRIQSVGDALLAIPRAISEANVIFERGTRVGVYRKLLREAPDANRVVPKTVFSQFTADDLARISKAVRARDATVDFSKSGTAMRVVNQVVPFMNPATQGGANIIRTMRDHPVRFLTLAAGFSGVAALVRLNNMRFETSDLIPDYEYIRYWIVQFGEGERKDGTKFPIYLRIPKGEFVAAATFPIEAIFHTARANEDRSAAELLLDAGISATEVVSPLDVRQGVFGIAPPLAGTAGGLTLGVDPFTKQQIIPRKEEQRLPEQQFGAETSSAAIALGQKFGISPRKIDFAIKDYTAGAGKAVLWLTDMALEILGYKPEVFGAEVEAPMTGVEAVSRTPLGRVFGTRATQEERRGWEKFNAVVEDTNRQFSVIPGMNSLGIKLGAVGDSIDMTPGQAGGSVELTPQQRAEYQQHMAQQVIPYMQSVMPQFSGIVDAEQKRKSIMGAMDAIKDVARASFISMLRSQPAQQRAVPSPAATLSSQPSDAGRMRQLRERYGMAEPVGAR